MRCLSLLLAGVLVVCGHARAFCQDNGLLRQLQQANVRLIESTEGAAVSLARVPVNRQMANPFASGVPGFGLPEAENPLDSGFVPTDFGGGVLIRTTSERHPVLILTNYHVVRGGPVFRENAGDAKFELYATLASRPGFRTVIVAADPHSDLAVLAVPADALGPAPTVLKPVSYEPKKGHFVFALGNPYAIARDGSASVSWGIVSNILRHPYANRPDYDNDFRLFETIHHFGTLMQIGVALPLGSSGGALLNLDGQLVGITTSLAPLKGYEQSAGYAVPFTPGFVRVLNELTQGFEVEYGFLGVRPATATPGDFDELPPAARPLGGTVVLAVTPNSPAQKAGLQPNDVVVEIQGRSLRDSLDLMREIGLEGPNRKVQLKVWRPRERKFLTRTATLGKWPVQNDADVIATSERYPAWRGVRVDYPTARARYLRSGGVVHFEDAVLVVDVDAERNGLRLQPGDFVSRVGETPVSTPEEFLKAVRGLGNRKAVLETIDGRTIEIDP